jgi:hypothetical protein
LKARADALGVPLVVVGIPDWRQLDDAYWQRDANKRRVDSGLSSPSAPDQLLSQIADRLGVPYLPLRPVFAPVVANDGLFQYFIEDDYHWTVDGNGVAADAVARFLSAGGYVPR